jgi:uncharacterized Rmd1/YagE family protein
MSDARQPFLRQPAQPSAAVRVHAVLLGERLNTAGLEHEGVIATAPLSLQVGERGRAVLFRYGVVVFFGLTPDEEAAVLERLSERLVGPEPVPEDETAQVVIGGAQDEQVTATGAIQLAHPTPEHFLIVADALAKSVALAHDERQVAEVLQAIEPFAAGLAARGRPPGGRGAILRMIGRALLVQHRVSGRVAVREKPDILWERPDLERLYGRLKDEYELVDRAETLDRKLASIGATTSALVDLQDADRSLRLEVVIVILILAELAIAADQLFGVGR